MVKLVFLCRRRPDLPHDRYVALLLEGHVPLALRHHPTMRRYVVNVVEEGAAAPALDSIGMLWFDSLADYRDRLYDSPEGARIIGRDVAGFLGGADAYATAEEIVVPPPAVVGTKTVLCLQRDARESRETFRARWRATADGLAGGRGYVASLVEPGLPATGPAYDGIAEVYDTPPASALDAHRVLAPVVHAYRVHEHVARG